ncbi:MAG: hypothetical protein AAGC60_01215 [Acidobacteriota bacterium]
MKGPDDSIAPVTGTGAKTITTTNDADSATLGIVNAIRGVKLDEKRQ